jgi:dihydroorotase-like cyclic amidohydrolase
MPRLGSVLRMNPPIRSAEHGKALFQGLLDGSIEAIATDHSPHTREEKLNDDIWKAISGFTSVETSLAAFLSIAVRPGDMTLEQLVRVTSEGPAKIWGMYPQKGALQLGSDGDLTIVDLDHTWTIDEEKLHSKNNVTPFNGVEVTGRAVGTIVRGRVVMQDGELVDEPSGRPVIPGAAQAVGAA